MIQELKCPLCNAKFTTIADLTSHLSTHQKPAVADITGKLEEAFKEAEKEKKSFPPAWDWSTDGDTFVGRILKVREISFTDRVCKVYECKMLNGNIRTLWGSPKVLKRLLDEKKPEIGDVLAVKNLGKPKGKRYYDFLVVVNPEGIGVPEPEEEAGKK
ncbi:MAG: C2H2-type zinc finger protein [Candidatus Bathyarchaeia archaeon]